MPASGSPNFSADTSRTTPYHLLLSLCRSTAFQSCQGYSGSVPYCWRIHVNNSCRVTPSLPRYFMCDFVQQPVAQSFASDTLPHCIDIRNHPVQHLSLPADQSNPKSDFFVVAGLFLSPPTTSNLFSSVPNKPFT